MYCSRCGAQSADDARFCAACGAPMQSPHPPQPATAAIADPGKRVRPALITVLAVIKLVTGCIWLLIAVALIAIPHSAQEGPVLSVISGCLFALGALALICAYGLWTLRSFGRYIQIAFSVLGLIGFPLQTVISVLILYYVFKPGVRVLFSATPIEKLSPVDRDHLRSLQSDGAIAILVAILVAIP